MNIEEWVAMPEHSQAKLARLAKTAPATINNIIKGRRKVSLLTALRFDLATKGIIKAEHICQEKDILLLTHIRGKHE